MTGSLKGLRAAGLLLAAALACTLATPRAAAQEDLEAVPLGYLLTTGQFHTHDRAGATMSAGEVNQQARYLGKRFQIAFAEAGSPEAARAAARRLVERRGARALLGSLGLRATLAVADYAQEAGVVFFNVGAPADVLRGEQCRRGMFHIGPGRTMRVRALGQWALHEREWRRWVVVHGPSRSERHLARAARQYLAGQGGEALQVVRVSQESVHDPQEALQAIRDAGADFVFVALTGERQGLFLKNYKASGIETPIGGANPEVARIARRTSQSAGYWPANWSHRNFRYGATQLIDRYAGYAGLPMTGRAWSAWAGVKILGESLLRVRSREAAALIDYLRDDMQFDGYMGDVLDFRPWNHQLRQKMRIVKVNHEPERNGWDALVPVGRIPLRGMEGGMDSIGFTRGESGCSL